MEGYALTMARTSPPVFPDGELPPNEPRSRRQMGHAIAIVAMLASTAYLSWRVSQTVNWLAWWLGVPLILCELYASLTLALFLFVTWNPASAPPELSPTFRGKLAVLIPTFNESVEVLLPTIAAAIALQPSHETWVLDDKRRPEVERLARALGANYLTRPTNEHAKAGNLNHALQMIDADLVAVFDADHVALPGFFLRTLGYFNDPRVALVQTPQDFYNLRSFEHVRLRSWFRHRRVHHHYCEESLFDRVIQPGCNRLGGAFWCGTGALLRVAALREVGGVAAMTITEDIHTTIRLHRRGWKSIYHNEVLARGLAAADFNQYSEQRVRWGAGAMQVLRVENPLTASGLTWKQRLSYANTILGSFDSWLLLCYLLIPPLVLFTGASPIRAPGDTYLVAFSVTYLLQRVAQRRFSRGRAPTLLSTFFSFLRMQANLQATSALLSRKSIPFRVTPKGRIGNSRLRSQFPLLLTVILLLNLVSAIWFALTLVGKTPLHYGIKSVVVGAALWLMVNCVFIVLGVQRVRDERFATERREAVRFNVALPGDLDDEPARVDEISWTGARVRVRKNAISEAVQEAQLRVHMGSCQYDLNAMLLAREPLSGSEEEVVLRFSDNHVAVRARLALALLHSGASWRVVPSGEGMSEPDAPPMVAVAATAGIAEAQAQADDLPVDGSRAPEPVLV